MRIENRCIHHSKETRNSRQLEHCIEHDSEGRPITQRKRERFPHATEEMVLERLSLSKVLNVVRLSSLVQAKMIVFRLLWGVVGVKAFLESKIQKEVVDSNRTTSIISTVYVKINDTNQIRYERCSNIEVLFIDFKRKTNSKTGVIA